MWQSAAAGVDDPGLQRRVLMAGNSCAAAYKELLEQVNVVSFSFFSFLFASPQCFLYFLFITGVNSLHYYYYY